MHEPQLASHRNGMEFIPAIDGAFEIVAFSFVAVGPFTAYASHILP